MFTVQNHPDWLNKLNINWNLFPSRVPRIKIKARQTRLLNWTAAMASKTWKRRLLSGSFPSPSEPMETRKIQTQVRRQGQAFELGIVGNRKKGVVLERAAWSCFVCTEVHCSGLSASLRTQTWRQFIGNYWTQWLEEGFGKSSICVFFNKKRLLCV